MLHNYRLGVGTLLLVIVAAMLIAASPMAQNVVDCPASAESPGGRVYVDRDEDGVYGTGDTPLAGMVVNKMAGANFATNFQTDENGCYRIAPVEWFAEGTVWRVVVPFDSPSEADRFAGLEPAADPDGIETANEYSYEEDRFPAVAGLDFVYVERKVIVPADPAPDAGVEAGASGGTDTSAAPSTGGRTTPAPSSSASLLSSNIGWLIILLIFGAGIAVGVTGERRRSRGEPLLAFGNRGKPAATK